MIEIYQQSQA